MRRVRTGVLFRIAAVVALVIAVVVAIRFYTRDYTVATEDNGLAVAQIVSARLDGASELRVSKLTGVVQATGSDRRWGGLLESTRVVKAPYEVSYFVDVGALDQSDFTYHRESRTLTVTAPPVTVGRPDVDESRVTVDQTSGVFVTRDAMAVLQQRVAASAIQTASVEANRPERIEQAQRYARQAISRLFGTTLEAAGQPTRVVVRFASDVQEEYVPSDRSRSLGEIVGAARPPG